MRNNATSDARSRNRAPGGAPEADRRRPARGRRGGAAPGEDGIVSSGVSFHLWRLYQHAWLICLLFPLVELVQAPLAPGRLGLGLGALVVFAAGYTGLMWAHPA